jgi:Zn-dependent alcohol dehydrogenase
MADLVILTVGHITGDQIQPAMWLTGKGGRVVVTAMGSFADNEVTLNLAELTLLQKGVQGAIFGGTGPRQQIPELLNYYRSGKLKLDELITTTYRLDEINRGFEDMRNGKNLRGVIVYDESDY